MTTRFSHRIWLPVLLLLGVQQGAAAQEVRVSALVNETTIGTEEAVSYTLEVGGVSFADIETPQPPETEGLVLQQAVPSTQRNITFINGELTQSIAFQWSYRPVREGTARLKPIAVTVKGRTYRTEEIRVTVVSQAQRPQGRSRSPLDPFASPFGRRRADPDDDAAPRSSITENDLFIRAVPSARRAFQNEQITIEYQLFFRNFIQPRHSRLADSWDAEGFWREELDVEARPMPRVTTLNGLRYNTIVLKRVAVFPTRSGTLTVDPLRIETEVFAPRGGSDPFGSFFPSINPYETVERASPPVIVEARPLPPDPPASFGGAVGRFDLSARLNRAEVEVGEPVQVTVRVAGTGNLAMLGPPPLRAPGVFEAYEPEVNLNLDSSGRQVRGSKTFSYLLVPRSNGAFEIPPVEFAFFDPQAGLYRTLRSEAMPVRVTGTATTPVAASATAGGLPVDDIARPLLEADWQRLYRTPLYRSPWTYALLALPLLLLGLLYGYRRYTTRLATDAAYARSRRAHPLARKHLKQAEALLRRDEPQAFFEELERAVLGFVGNRLNVAELGMTRTQLDARLAEAGLAETLRSDLLRLLAPCDQARFAPDRSSTARMDAALDAARGLIVALDDAFLRQAAAT